MVRGQEAGRRLLDLFRGPVPPQHHRHLFHPRLRQQQEEPGGPHHRLCGEDPRAGDEGRPVRRRAVSGRDPDGPRRPDPGLVPHLEPGQRPGRPALARGLQAGRWLLDLPHCPVGPLRHRRLLHPRLPYLRLPSLPSPNSPPSRSAPACRRCCPPMAGIWT